MILFRRTIADYRRSLAWWSVGVCGAVVLIIAIYPSLQGQQGLEDIFEQLPPTVKALAGARGGLSIISPVGYLHSRLFVLFLPLLLIIFGIGAGARAIGGSEADRTLEFLLSHPISRRRVALEKFGAMAAMVAALGAVGTVAALGMCAAVGIVPPVSIPNLVGACAATTCLALLFATLAFAVGCLAGRRSAALSVASIVTVVSYLVHSLFALVPSLSWMRPLSPWHWYLSEVILMDGPALLSFALPLAGTAALLAAGMWRFERRDMR